jgi:long-chain acyl-CoA synthetase
MPWKVCKPMDERLKCSAAGRGEDSGGVPRLRHGTLTIRGRKKEMAIVGGFSVSPREIEDVLLMHPAVVEAAAIGVPDSYRGEVVRAFVVAPNTRDANEQTLIAHCGENLVRYKVPAAIELVSELPKTAGGKG